jgi:UDP-GlcNAc:undecaprenyl-phosphate GlcNAc-1-phosphate transferase
MSFMQNRSTDNRLPVALIATLLLAFFWLAVFHNPAPHHPLVVTEAPDNLQFSFLLQSHPSAAECETAAANIASAIQTGCRNCIIKQQQCLRSLDATQQRYLSTEPLGTPSVRLANGVVVFSSSNAELPLAACRESERKAFGNSDVKCYPANTLRTSPIPDKVFAAAEALWGLVPLIVACMACWLTCLLILRYQHLHAHLSHDQVDSGPQKFHAVPTPRIGGIGVLAGLLAGAGVVLFLRSVFSFSVIEFACLLLAGVPAFLGGIAEDLTKRTSVAARLLLTMVSAAVGALLLDAVLNRLDIPGIDAAFNSLPFAVAFTIFAVAGVTNAINIIDGYNGLASGYAVLVLAALAWVAAQVGDSVVLAASLTMLGALIGFMAWNYPRGKIFLGDGGAYLLGFWLAELSVLLVVRHPDLSPWFPLLLLVYPIFETLFSIYRKRLLRGYSPGHPDGLHLHMLIYKRLLGIAVESKNTDGIAHGNNRVAPYIWMGSLLFIVPSLFWWRSTPVLVVLTVVFCGAYLWQYRRLADESLRRSDSG